MNQGTYRGIIEIRDLADPTVLRTLPATLVLGSGKHTPTIAVNRRSIAVTLKTGSKKTVKLVLHDASHTCGFVYSLQINRPWATTGSGLYSGSVGAQPASGPPSANDTGQGNGFTPIAISAKGLVPGSYRAQVAVDSENAAASPTRIPITLTVRRR